MAKHVYKTIELTVQVLDTRGEIEGAKVAQWQVTLKVGFTLDD
jgi:flavin-binding protein dodecin